MLEMQYPCSRKPYRVPYSSGIARLMMFVGTVWTTDCFNRIFDRCINHFSHHDGGATGTDGGASVPLGPTIYSYATILFTERTGEARASAYAHADGNFCLIKLLHIIMCTLIRLRYICSQSLNVLTT